MYNKGRNGSVVPSALRSMYSKKVPKDVLDTNDKMA